MRSSKDGRYDLFQPFGNQVVLGNRERGATLEEISAYFDRRNRGQD